MAKGNKVMTRPAGSKKDVLKKQATPYLYLLPTVALMSVLLVVPIIMVIG